MLSTLTKLEWSGFSTKQDAIFFNTWLTIVMREHFSALEDNDTLNTFLNTHAALTSFYHQVKRAKKKNPKKVAKLFDKSVKAAAKRLDRWPDGPPLWGGAHPLAIAPPLETILTKGVGVPIERDGSWFTVDVSGYRAGHYGNQLTYPTFYGANFRVVFQLEAGKPIKAKSVTPLGGGGKLDPYGALQELRMWQDGKLRDFVDFVR